MSKEFQEEAKKRGMSGSEYMHWLKERAKEEKVDKYKTLIDVHISWIKEQITASKDGIIRIRVVDIIDTMNLNDISVLNRALSVYGITATTGKTENGEPLLIMSEKKRQYKKEAKKLDPINKMVHKDYHFWRWKIKRFLIEEKIIEKVIDWKTVLDVFDPVIVDILKDINIVNESEFKERLDKQRSLLIEHHTKYKEIHGVDETKWMTVSEHRYLHNRLRREGKCNIPPDELENISLAAGRRTEKHKEYLREYEKTEKKKMLKSKYCKANIMRIMFTDTLTRNVRLREEFAYNIVTNTFTVSSGFIGDHGIKLMIIQID